MLTPVLLASSGAALSVGSFAAYLSTIPSGKVPARPLGHFALQAVGASLAIGGIAAALVSGGGVIAPAVAGTMGLTVSGLFAYLYSQRATPVGNLRVKVGDPLRPFTALTPEGTTFDTASLRGRRVLLKFFRGHW